MEHRLFTSLNGKAGIQLGYQFIGSNPVVNGLIVLIDYGRVV